MRVYSVNKGVNKGVNKTVNKTYSKGSSISDNGISVKLLTLLLTQSAFSVILLRLRPPAFDSARSEYGTNAVICQACEKSTRQYGVPKESRCMRRGRRG